MDVKPTMKVLKKIKKEDNKEETLLKRTGMSIHELEANFPFLKPEEQRELKKKYGKSLLLVKENTSAKKDVCECAILKLIEFKKNKNKKTEIIAQNNNEKEKQKKKQREAEERREEQKLDKNTHGLEARTGLSLEECRKRLHYVSKSYQEAMVKRFGENLDELNPYEKEEKQLEGQVNNCINFIKKEPFLYEKTKSQNDSVQNGVVARTGLSLEECRKRLNYAPKHYQEAMHIRFGANLDELLPYDSKKNQNLVFHCIRFMKTEPFSYQNTEETKKESTSSNNKQEKEEQLRILLNQLVIQYQINYTNMFSQLMEEECKLQIIKRMSREESPNLEAVLESELFKMFHHQISRNLYSEENFALVVELERFYYEKLKHQFPEVEEKALKIAIDNACLNIKEDESLECCITRNLKKQKP